MTWFEIYALFGSPILLLLLCLAVVWLTGRQDNRERPSTPAE
jgi:cytochrome c-type biogenesis protein CcmH/NrfF